MDAYYRKTRRPITTLSSSLKRPPPKASITSHLATTNTTSATTTPGKTPNASLSTTNAEFLRKYLEKNDTPQSPPKTPRRPQKAPLEFQPPRPTTPTNARLTRPIQPPPVKRKILTGDLRLKKKPSVSVKELFKSAHLLNDEEKQKFQRSPQKWGSPVKQQVSTIISSPQKQTLKTTTTTPTETTVAESLGLKKLILPATPPSTPRKNLERLDKLREQLHRTSPKKSQNLPESPSKIASGPLKGISTSLLDLIRAKEAKAKETPEQKRQRELLGIAPDIARIVPTLFTSHKREVMSYEKIIEKCYKALNSNYSSVTIMECFDLMNKVAPEWVTIVEISRGKFVRLNKDKYTLPQLSEAIKRYKDEKNC